MLTATNGPSWATVRSPAVLGLSSVPPALRGARSNHFNGGAAVRWGPCCRPGPIFLGQSAASQRMTQTGLTSSSLVMCPAGQGGGAADFGPTGVPTSRAPKTCMSTQPCRIGKNQFAALPLHRRNCKTGKDLQDRGKIEYKNQRSKKGAR